MGRPAVPVSGVPWWAMRTLGVVQPLMGEIVGVRHQFDQDFVTDSSATTDAFGLTATPWDEVVAATAGAARVAG
jgi:hypothetical protein